MTASDLARFVTAQDQTYDQVVQELTKGAKRSHWMWFIFPQIIGLGRSPTAQRYAITDLEQAKRYLADPVLGARLRQCVQLVLAHSEKSAEEIFGYPDDLKFRSCLTLFAQVAAEGSDRLVFIKALDQFYDGEPDPRTLEILGLDS